MLFRRMTSVVVVLAIMVGISISDVNAADKDIIVSSRTSCGHTSMIGSNRSETSNIIISNSKEVSNYILVNQYDGLPYALMNSANAARIGAYILPVNNDSIPKQQQYFLASDESIVKLKLVGNSSSFKNEFTNELSSTYLNVENNIADNISKASVDNLNRNFSNSNTVFIVNGTNGLADAMSIAPVSYRDQIPILFTTNDGKKIDGYTKKNGVKYIAIGGNQVISDSLVKEYNATRIYGATRYETNKAVLAKYYPNRDIAYFTNGDTLVDALSSVHMTKDDGIVLLNHKKNHDLISNIDTYQIGGIAGYEFNYKNENGKFANVSKVSAKKKNPVNNSTTKDKVYQHKINLDNIISERYTCYQEKKYVTMIINNIKNNNYTFDLESENNFNCLWILGKYLEYDGDLYYYNLGKGKYRLSDEGIKIVRKLLPKAIERENNYKENIYNALSEINLNCSNYEIINNINKYIVDNFSYKIIDGPISSFTNNNQGQCMHYAMMFTNMCAAVGINVDYIEGESSRGFHAWNRAVFDNQIYYFDITWNDNGSSNYNRYMWLTSNPHGNINE